MRHLLAAEGSEIGRRHVTTLITTEALYGHPRTTKPESGHKIPAESSGHHQSQ